MYVHLYCIVCLCWTCLTCTFHKSAFYFLSCPLKRVCMWKIHRF